jgi:signal transduction histidine kinase
MRHTTARDPGEGSDERPPVARSAAEPPRDGEALVEHLVERLGVAERELARVRAMAREAAAHRSLLGHAARLVAEGESATLGDLVQLAVPALGDWCIAELVTPEGVVRMQAGDGPELAAASRAGIVMDWVRDSSPSGDSAHDLDETPAGPRLVVPVRTHGALVAGLAWGRAEGDVEHDVADERLGEDLGVLAAVLLERRRLAEVAEQATRAKSEFLTMMSHELRTPLNAIAGYAQLLEMGFRGPLTDDQREAVSRILRGQEHLLELVDAVLTFSRLTSGALELDASELSAAALLRLASEPLEREFDERGIHLDTAPCAAEVRVLGDLERAPQVLRHLLTNALKFTPEGGVVRLACECDGDLVRFTVSDTGRGIPAAQREAIFQPFVQAERGHTRSVDGSGLGLAIGRELAQRMRGTLTVTSEEGVGSRFVLTLRRAGSR